MAIKFTVTPEESEGRVAVRAEGGKINEAFYLGRRDPDGIVRTVRETTDASKVWTRDPTGARKNLFTRPRFELVSTQNLLTNLYRNPLMVPKAAPVASTLRTNFARNPSFEIDGAAEVQAGGGTAALSQTFSGAQAGSAALRATWTKAGTAGKGGIFANTFPVTAGKTYTVSGYIRTSGLKFFKPQIGWNSSTQLFTSYSMGAQHQIRAFNQTENPGWWRVSVTATAPAGAVAGVACFFLDPASSSKFNAGDWMELDGILEEEGNTVKPYFDGSTDGVILPAEGAQASTWAGDAHNSTSQLFSREVHELFGRNASARDWNGAAGIKPTGTSTDSSVTLGTGDAGALRSGLQAGKTYTIAATLELEAVQPERQHVNARKIIAFTRVGTGAVVQTESEQMPNEVGNQRISLTFSVPAGSTEAYIRIYNGSDDTTKILQVRDIVLIEGSDVVSNMSGLRGSIPGATYAWQNPDVYPEGTIGESIATASVPSGGFINTGVYGTASTVWKAAGTYSLRQIASSDSTNSFTAAPAAVVNLEAGKTYTARAELYQAWALTGQLDQDSRRLRVTGTGMSAIVSAQPANAAGRKTVWLTFTVPAGATNVRLEFVHGGSYGSGELFWDLVMVTDGKYTGAYFDGYVTDPLLGGWDGTVNASTSSRYSDTLPITVYDYEAQQGATVEYLLLDQTRGVITGTSIPVDLPNWGTWIKDPLRPYLNVKVALNDEGNQTHESNRTLLQPRGSRNVIAQWEARTAPHGSMKFLTMDREDRRKFLDLIEQTGVALIDAPYDFDIFARYVSLGDVVGSRPVAGRLSASARIWEVQVDEVLPPIGETVGMAATYENVALAFSSYLALSASVENYRELVAGGWA